MIQSLLSLMILTTLLIGCGSKTQTITELRVEKVYIPKELLELDKLEKPKINNENDVLNAYIMLFKHYKNCEINIEKIKELNDN